MVAAFSRDWKRRGPADGRQSSLRADFRADWLLNRLADQPDITLHALLAELTGRGIKVSYYAVWHFFEHQGISFKKSLHTSEQDRPDVARRGRNGKRIKGRLIPLA